MPTSTMLLRGIGAGVGVLALIYLFGYSSLFALEYRSAVFDRPNRFIPLPELDKADYNARMLALAHVGTTTETVSTATTSVRVVSTASTISPQAASTTSISSGQASSPQATTPSLWPVSTAYPNARAILPFQRVVAYYGNFYSKQMGVLGEYPADEMLAMLASTTAQWAAADPRTPALPAIHYIAVVAQASAGKEGKYILRMPDDQIDHALDLANRIQGIVFLDIQVGKSTLEYELPQLEKYLKMPQVHLAIDPEFSMKFGDRPGTVIGTFDAQDIQYAAEYLAGLVRDNHLSPKILVVHRFTQNMVTNYKKIRPLPEVQIVIDMDGFGSKELKIGTYTRAIYPEPVQFTGIKLFYKNDARSPSGMFTPDEVLRLTPAPIYIQYQ